MSNSTFFESRPQSEAVSATIMQKVRAVLSGRNAEAASLTNSVRSKPSSAPKYLDTCHLNDHVLKDIGLNLTDLTKP